MDFNFAPVQGHTDAPYRHFHKLSYGNDISYHTPFIRLEQGDLRQRDVKDFTSPLNDGCNLTPQIIFRDESELRSLVSLVKEKGCTRIDLNMGCPFPLQTGHGRGAATIGNRQLGEAVARIVASNPDVLFSVKMRLGMNDPHEWSSLLPILNKVRLKHITVHPRVARQQYGGEVNSVEFRKILDSSSNPVVYNGDIRTPSDIDNIIHRFPEVTGIMIGRGMLARPSLLAEYLGGNEWNRDDRITKMLEFHRILLGHYSSVLCGDSQLISKIKPFWEYAEDEIGRKAWKSIKKATNIAKYHSAVAMIGND